MTLSLDSYRKPLKKAYTRTHCGLCGDTLLRHIRSQKLCLYCPTCRQDTPYNRQSSVKLQPQLKAISNSKHKLTVSKHTSKQTLKSAAKPTIPAVTPESTVPAA